MGSISLEQTEYFSFKLGKMNMTFDANVIYAPQAIEGINKNCNDDNEPSVSEVEI